MGGECRPIGPQSPTSPFNAILTGWASLPRPCGLKFRLGPFNNSSNKTLNSAILQGLLECFATSLARGIF